MYSQLNPKKGRIKKDGRNVIGQGRAVSQKENGHFLVLGDADDFVSYLLIPKQGMLLNDKI
jgi:hypothetical protein